jgi:hypothetical protein
MDIVFILSLPRLKCIRVSHMTETDTTLTIWRWLSSEINKRFQRKPVSWNSINIEAHRPIAPRHWTTLVENRNAHAAPKILSLLLYSKKGVWDKCPMGGCLGQIPKGGYIILPGERLVPFRKIQIRCRNLYFEERNGTRILNCALYQINWGQM